MGGYMPPTGIQPTMHLATIPAPSFQPGGRFAIGSLTAQAPMPRHLDGLPPEQTPRVAFIVTVALRLQAAAVRATLPALFSALLLDKLAGLLQNVHGLSCLSVVD